MAVSPFGLAFCLRQTPRFSPREQMPLYEVQYCYLFPLKCNHHRIQNDRLFSVVGKMISWTPNFPETVPSSAGLLRFNPLWDKSSETERLNGCVSGLSYVPPLPGYPWITLGYAGQFRQTGLTATSPTCKS
ncbi:hypothetical protein V8C34DRAFT_266840 [Trichoderma compactum]